MMPKHLDGHGPVINLDASDAMAETFTFNVDHDIEIYDDLTIQGDGNQKFAINGQTSRISARSQRDEDGHERSDLGWRR